MAQMAQSPTVERWTVDVYTCDTIFDDGILDAVEFIRHSSDSTPQSLDTYIPDRFFNEPLAFGIDFPRFALIGADIYLITHTHALCGVPVKDPVKSEDDGKNSIPTENERLCLSFKIPNGTWISNREHWQ